jgi:hypothetical protein
VKLRVTAKDATWMIRETAWDLEEKVLWRGSDAAHRALSRALRPTLPLHWLIETKLAWPLADAFRRRGTAARAGITSAVVAAALAAAGGGAIVAGDLDPSSSPGSPAPLRSAAGAAPVLQGATPDFEIGEAKVPASTPAAAPTAPPARVAWQFAHAFVRYEVGKLDQRTAAGFAATTTPELAKSLSEEPPRLPAGNEVPEARVLNVVLGERTAEETTASVSILRLQAISEVRLTLQQTKDGWRVSGVLG